MLPLGIGGTDDHPGPIGAFFRRLRKRKRYNVAVIGTARKLVTVAYLMLKNNEPYRYAKPDVVRGKLADCRRKAGKAPSRAKAAGSGGSRLNDLYREHGLPACLPAAGGVVGRGAARPRRSGRDGVRQGRSRATTRQAAGEAGDGKGEVASTSIRTERLRPAGWRAAVGSLFFIPWPDPTLDQEWGHEPDGGPAISGYSA